jgi:SAM-dependent methyltransferase
MREQHQLSLARAVSDWWHTAVARDGFFRTLRRFSTELWDFARDSTPARRRQRYGDVDYDWEHRVDTTSATVGWRERLLGVFLSAYQATDPAVFHEMMACLAIDFSQFTFIDLGSGKGRTLLMASDYPFRRIVGVELLPALHRIAQENIARYKNESQKCFAIESVNADAREFEFPAERLVLYLFNPLPEAGLVQVMENLKRSLHEHPRALYVVYHNPLLESVVRNETGLRRLAANQQYSIYASEVTAWN